MQQAVFRRSRTTFATLLFAAFGSFATAAAFAGPANSTHDNLGRLTRVANGNGVVITYQYDAAGNRAAQVLTGAPA
jgi:YD repeat-containing protein